MAKKLPTSNPPPTPSVEVCPEVYVMIPDYRKIEGKFIAVRKETVTACMSLCAENGLLDFGVRVIAWHRSPTLEDRGSPLHTYIAASRSLHGLLYPGPESIEQLDTELMEVDDWFHLGMQIGVSSCKLRAIKMAYQQFPDHGRSEMLYHYMKEIENKKWLTIVQALDRIGQRTLAIKIALKYGNTLNVDSML